MRFGASGGAIFSISGGTREAESTAIAEPA
jgi:hypothetical protein